MKPVEFVAQAREEFLLEVEYYNSERRGLGARFAQDVEEAVARAVTIYTFYDPRWFPRSQIGYTCSQYEIKKTCSSPAAG